jgi:formate/nitrite transporter FocA (FNT family)
MNKDIPQRKPDSEQTQAKIHLPDGSISTEKAATVREKARRSEDQEYVPVIIKRTDETRRHPDDTLDNAICEGLEQLNRPAVSLAFASIAAGSTVGFSAMAVAVVHTAIGEFQLAELVARIATAFVYPLGFVVCILSGAQLFTEHTATAFYPVLDRRASFRQLGRLWAIVIIGNLVGAAICALLLVQSDEVIHARSGYLEIGHHLVRFSTLGLFISAILAGWLMALGAWLAVSSPRTIAQITVIYYVTFLIGIGGLHHSIAGSVELFTAMLLSSEFTPAMAFRFIFCALAGNLIGGSGFVALLNYGHIRRTNE